MQGAMVARYIGLARKLSALRLKLRLIAPGSV
jgi:hypothetical protein